MRTNDPLVHPLSPRISIFSRGPKARVTVIHLSPRISPITHSSKKGLKPKRKPPSNTIPDSKPSISPTIYNQKLKDPQRPPAPSTTSQFRPFCWVPPVTPAKPQALCRFGLCLCQCLGGRCGFRSLREVQAGCHGADAKTRGPVGQLFAWILRNHPI